MERGRYYGVCAATLEAVRLRHPIVVVVAGGSLDGLNFTRALERCELYNFHEGSWFGSNMMKGSEGRHKEVYIL